MFYPNLWLKLIGSVSLEGEVHWKSKWIFCCFRQLQKIFLHFRWVSITNLGKTNTILIKNMHVQGLIRALLTKYGVFAFSVIRKLFLSRRWLPERNHTHCVVITYLHFHMYRNHENLTFSWFLWKHGINLNNSYL